MKKIILSLLLLPFGSSAGAQDSGHKLNTVFTADMLSATELNSFEKRAQQKIIDFYNYMDIVSDPKYDMALREEAKKQALELFSYKTNMVHGVSVEKMLDSCLKVTQKTRSYAVTDPKVTSKLLYGVDSPVYTGSLSFSLYVASSNASIKEAMVIMLKTEKLFGTEKKQVWTIYLYSIN